MADSFTPNLNLRKPEVGAAFDTWGGSAGLNADLDLLDAVFLATGLGTSVGIHVGSGKVLNIDGTGQLSAMADGISIKDNTDPTKVLTVSVAGIATATTRELSAPDESGIIATREYLSQTRRNPVGTVLYGYYGPTAPAGYLFLNGTTFGKGTSAATQRANDDTLALYDHFWTTLAMSPVGGRGANMLADWNANKVFATPNHAGRAPFALDNNGGITSANILTPGAGANATVRGGAVGQSQETATVSGSASVSGTAFTAGVGVTASGSGQTGGSFQNVSAAASGQNVATGGHVHDFGVNVSGSVSGNAAVNASGSISGNTANVTNVPPGVAMDCVIAM